MYLPAHFEETDAAEVAALMAAFPLACLVAQTPEGLVANHLPLLVGPDGALFGASDPRSVDDLSAGY